MIDDPTSGTISGVGDSKPANGFVAVLDVLGFKSMTVEQQVNVASLLEQAVDEILPQLWVLRAEQVTRWLQPPIVKMFSDTIVVAFPMKPENRVAQDLFHYVNDYLGMLFSHLLLEGVKLRGTVGYGTVIDRKYSLLGRAIVDAACEYESTSWSGIHYSVAASAVIEGWRSWVVEDGGERYERTLPATEHNLNQAQFYETNVPFKENHKLPTTMKPETARLRFTVPWPKDVRGILHVRQLLLSEPEHPYTRIRRVLEPEIESCHDPSVKIKLVNTLEYASRYLQQFPGTNEPLRVSGPLPPMGT